MEFYDKKYFAFKQRMENLVHEKRKNTYKIYFKSEYTIDKIQLSLNSKYFTKIKLICDSLLGNCTTRYDKEEDRLIYGYILFNKRIEIATYEAKNQSRDNKKRIYISFRMYDPTPEIQMFVLQNIINFIPQKRRHRHLTNIEFAVDLYPKNIKKLRPLKRIIIHHATIPYAQKDNIKIRGEAKEETYTMGSKEDNVESIIYENPKGEEHTSVHLEIRFFNDSITRLFNGNTHYANIIETRNAIDYIVFRQSCNVEKVRRSLENKSKKAIKLTQRVTLLMKRQHLPKALFAKRRTKGSFRQLTVAQQIRTYKRYLQNTGIQSRLERHFPEIIEIKDDIAAGYIKSKY